MGKHGVCALVGGLALLGDASAAVHLLQRVQRLAQPARALACLGVPAALFSTLISLSPQRGACGSGEELAA